LIFSFLSDFAVLKSDAKLSEVNLALQSKVSSLVCVSRKQVEKKHEAEG
jgi:hypothetical protein